MIIGDCPRGSPVFYKSEEYYGYLFYLRAEEPQ